MYTCKSSIWFYRCWLKQNGNEVTDDRQAVLFDNRVDAENFLRETGKWFFKVVEIQD